MGPWDFQRGKRIKQGASEDVYYYILIRKWYFVCAVSVTL